MSKFLAAEQPAEDHSPMPEIAAAPAAEHDAADFAAFQAWRAAQAANAPMPEIVEEPEQRIAVTVQLKPFHHQYLVARAAEHGETPERHLESILRNFRSYHDDRRPDQRRAMPDRGEPAASRRA